MTLTVATDSHAAGAMTLRVLQALPSTTPPAEAIALLRGNKFPLLSLDLDATPEWLVRSEEFRQALADDEAELELQRSEFSLVRDAWAQAGIEWMFIKTGCIAPSFPYASDNLDIMVRPEKGEQAKRILRRLSYVELINAEEESKFLFRRFRGGRSVCAIHVHTWVGWDLNFFESDLLWRRARVAPDDALVVAPSPEDALLINLAHAFFENKVFTLHDLEKVRVAWQQNEPDWEYLPQMPARCGWHDGFLLSALVAADLEEAIVGETGIPQAVRDRWLRELERYPMSVRYYRHLRKQPKTMPFRVNFVFSKLLYYRKIQRDRRDSALKKVSNTVRTMGWGFKQKSGIRPMPGVLVAMSGVDGSGKTSHLEELTRVLETSGAKYRIYWNRVGCSPFTRLISKAFRSASKTDGHRNGELPTPAKLVSRNTVTQAAWAWVMVVDLLARYAVRVRMPLTMGRLGLGRVVLCDRYVLDAAAEISLRTSDRNMGVRSALWALRTFSPRPQLTYLVDVPAEVAAERHNGPISLEEVQAYRDMYRKLAAGYDAHVVDGTAPLTETGDALQVEVVKAFQRRFPTPLNALLLSNPKQLNPKLQRDVD